LAILVTCPTGFYSLEIKMRKHVAVLIFCAASISSFAQNAVAPSAFVTDFSKHWATAKTLTLAVAKAMPEENYAFKPVSEEMSLGEQLMHLTQANFGYCAFIADAKPPYEEPKDSKTVKKETILKDLGDSFDYCSKLFDGLTEADLGKMHGPAERHFEAREVMLGLMLHMAHHRGQAEVYLRLKGIKPPDYKW
jgi:uncharacterized damage-inducible protein DinB